ncbi:HAD family hydrolase [Paenibacillus sp. N1-5-1-14]|uniref:HAD family hydrolase n=1 Tax=Paenibacillus radicibacter TaxID=2972488 RepID=UPI002159797E|nr:HAD family hydrolase [Paenibacillus radicibacter]MCR8643574.1 HAD family hydrolase [Paenibacillus radicibacter]
MTDYNKQIILFDLDDTLVHCNRYFNVVLDQFADEMLSYFNGQGLTAEEILERQIEIDLAGTAKHGFLPEKFPDSLVETYQHYCEQFGRPEVKDEIDFLNKLGFSAYSFPIEPYPDMIETLQTLQEAGHTLCLYTGGDVSIQMRKVDDTGIGKFFEDRIFITLHKNTEFLRYIIETQEFDRSRTWMIGNSVRTDIMPALDNGIHAIQMIPEIEWAYNLVENTSTPKGAFYIVNDLKEVPVKINEYLSS